MSPLLIQVCESLADDGTRKRELRALTEAMTELGINIGMIVTRAEADQINETGCGSKTTRTMNGNNGRETK